MKQTTVVLKIMKLNPFLLLQVATEFIVGSSRESSNDEIESYEIGDYD